MKTTFQITALLLFVVSLLQPATAQDDWRRWRGPQGDGTAKPGQDYPVRWGESENVLWKTPVPGRGHSSPIVVDDRIFLTTADEQKQIQSLLCFDRFSGRPLWSKEISRGGFNPKIHPKNTHATPSPVSNGTDVFVVFNHHEGVQVASIGIDGTEKWKRKAGDYLPKAYQFGFAATPLLHDDTVIVTSDFESAGFLAAFDTASGAELWRHRRPPTLNYSSPIIADVAGRQQLLISGCKQVAGIDPANGQSLWSVPGMWTVTCGTMVWDDRLVFASGGYPDKGTMAVRADGSGEIAWQNRVKCYEQSMLIHEGHLYGIDDAGIAYCWQADTGQEKWKQRLGGPQSASPILAGGNIYVLNERGKVFVFRPDPDRFVAVAENRIGSEGFATPAFCGGRIYARSASRETGSRQEFLTCIGSD